MARVPASGRRTINAGLHAERLDDSRRQRHHAADLDALPDGAFVAPRRRAVARRAATELRRWTPAGYTDALPRPSILPRSVITPPSLVATLAAGWEPTAVPFIA